MNQLSGYSTLKEQFLKRNPFFDVLENAEPDNIPESSNGLLMNQTDADLPISRADSS